MGEIVQRQMEYMAEEFEEMRRTKLYTNEEVRSIMKKHKAFEEKVHSVTKTLQDFKDYIQYKKYLLKDLGLRRTKLKIDGKKGSLEHKIIKKIKGLFETALQRFSNEFSLYLSYFKFCKQVNYVNAASSAVESMLKHHMDKPEVWQVAAKWYMYNRNDIKYALKIILKGLTIHSDSKILYTQAIEFEILAVNDGESSSGANIKVKCDDDDFRQNICCKKLKTYISSIFANIKDVEYYIEILKMLESHKFTESVQNYLIEELLKEHSEKCIVWHTLAQRELRLPNKRPETDNDSKLNVTKNRLTACFEKYEQGLKRVSETEKLSLWSNYLDCLIEMKQKNNRVSDMMKKALEDAYRADCLPEKYFVTWLEVVDDNDALEVLEKGTIAYPKSVDLWKLRLRYQIIKDTPEEVNKVFKAGITELKENSLPLWLSVIRYHLLTSDSKLIESIYEDGIKQPPEVSNQLKPRYLEWIALEKGIKEARNIYNRIYNEIPHNKELHLVMLKLEATEIEYNFEEWEKVHVNICGQFGKEDVDVWINYIQFFAHFNRNEHSNEKIQRIYKQAEEMLPPLLMSYFIDKYTNTLAALS